MYFLYFLYFLNLKNIIVEFKKTKNAKKTVNQKKREESGKNGIILESSVPSSTQFISFKGFHQISIIYS